MNKNDADEKMVSHSTEGSIGGGEHRSEPIVGDVLDNFGDRSGNRSMQVSPSPTIQNSAEQLAQELTPRRAVSYLRVSTREQARRGGREEGFSIPAQRAANKRKAMSIGAIIGKEFTEGGVSATTTRRPALQAMLRYLEEEARAGRPVDYVIVHKLDRLVRNRYDDTTLGKRFDELGVRLVSTSENIDQTPGGLLVHGIMASIAEFYSKNLSNEVKKGMAEKVRGGGCIGRAPLGYRNVITTKNGQEARIVVVDEVRGPLVAWAFEAYASGEWTLRRLAEELTLRGLTTVPTASLPEKPVTVQLLSKVLHNPFYVGEVVYQGMHYAGSHEPLADRATYETVQTLLATRVNGERTVKHAHYLKSTIYCGICGSRLIVTNVKPRGVVYEYFVCLGRHSKKQPQCSFRATLAEQIEDEIVRLYDRVALRPGQRAVLETALQRQLAMLVAESTQRLTEAKTVRRRLERERDKLLQAHYADAIPLDVLKREQSRISRELRGVERQLTGLEGEMTERQALVGQALDIAQHMATAYRQAPEHIRRMLNQVLFDKVYITPDDETGLLTAMVRYQPPFDGVLGVRGGEPCLSKEGVEVGDGDNLEASGDDEVTLSQPSDIVVSASEGPGLHGLPDDGLPAPKPSKNKQKPTSWGFHDVGLSVDSMVGVAGFEPTTSSSRTKRATKLRHTPCAAGDSIASTHRGEEIGSAESSVTSMFAPCRNLVGPRRPPCQAAYGRSACWPAPRSTLSGPGTVILGPHPAREAQGLTRRRTPAADKEFPCALRPSSATSPPRRSTPSSTPPTAPSWAEGESTEPSIAPPAPACSTPARRCVTPSCPTDCRSAEPWPPPASTCPPPGSSTPWAPTSTPARTTPPSCVPASIAPWSSPSSSAAPASPCRPSPPVSTDGPSPRSPRSPWLRPAPSNSSPTPIPTPSAA